MEEKIDEEYLIQFVTIGVRENLIPLCLLGKISRLAKYYYEQVQWRIDNAFSLRRIYKDKLASAYKARILRGPIEYTGLRTKVIPIEEMGFSDMGMAILDTLPPAPFQYGSQVLAFANVQFLVRRPVPFMMMLSLGNASVYSRQYSTSDYTYVGEKTHNAGAAPPQENGAVEPVLAPTLPNGLPAYGGYLLDMKLPTLINPIPIHRGFLDYRALRICMTQHFRVVDGDLEVLFDPRFVIEYFSHCVVQFRTFDELEYNTSDYALSFNGDINGHIYKYSFVRRKNRIEDDVYAPRLRPLNTVNTNSDVVDPADVLRQNAAVQPNGMATQPGVTAQPGVTVQPNGMAALNDIPELLQFVVRQEYDSDGLSDLDNSYESDHGSDNDSSDDHDPEDNSDECDPLSHSGD
jgi:hypothetical protein